MCLAAFSMLSCSMILSMRKTPLFITSKGRGSGRGRHAITVDNYLLTRTTGARERCFHFMYASTIVWKKEIVKILSCAVSATNICYSTMMTAPTGEIVIKDARFRLWLQVGSTVSHPSTSRLLPPVIRKSSGTDGRHNCCLSVNRYKANPESIKCALFFKRP